jgi:predicted dehydrogenase
MKGELLKVGAIGCGYWGPNLIRNFVELPEAALVAVADLDRSRLEHIQTRYPAIEFVTERYEDLFDQGLDAVVVSTPPQTHFEIVSACLEQGLHVLVEKPMTTGSADARRLIELADERGLVLMVGHTFEYNAAVWALRDMIQTGELGEIRYIDTVRVGLGLFHPSLNVVWDLAPHDISILIHVLGEVPETVSTNGIACVQPTVEDVAYMTLGFPSGIMAHTRMSWLDPCKTRRVTVVGSSKMAVYDDIATQEMIKVYDKRVDATGPTDTWAEFQFDYHYGSIVSPHIDFAEPLQLEAQHFARCIAENEVPMTDGANGLQVVEVIEAAQRSLARHGALEPIERWPVSEGIGTGGMDPGEPRAFRRLLATGGKT